MFRIFLFIMFFPVLAFSAGLESAMEQSIAGMKAQSERMKIISQNIANSDAIGIRVGQDPYRRKLIVFENAKNRRGGDLVRINKITRDYKAPFKARFDPNHPAADVDGYILLPNVNRTIESADMKEAQRSYEANLGAIDTTKRMYLNTIELLR